MSLSESKYYKKKNSKLFFLHQSDKVYHLMNINIKGESIIADIITDGKVISSSAPDLNEKKGGRIKENMRGITNEVHIYLKPDVDIGNSGSVKLENHQIETIYGIQPDPGKDILVYFAVVAGIVFVAGIIALLTKSSCPYVYSFDGEKYVFEGEIYSGAVLHNLERHDYMHLPSIKPSNGKYSIRISNELKERQYINQAELFVANHPGDSKVFFTEAGVPIMIKDEILPISAISESGIDQLTKLAERDTIGFSFNETDIENQNLSLTFQKPAHSKNATLLLRGKNTEWGDHIFGEFAQKFGNKFNKWNRTLKKKSKEDRLQGVLDTEMPLTVRMKIGTDWALIDHFYMVGPLGERELILPLDLSEHHGDQVEIQLSTGFNFWNLNYAAMDFSEKSAVPFHTIPISELNGSTKQDKEALAFDDEKYLEQKKTGDKVELHFQTVDVPSGKSQSVFLHCKGYYEHVRHFKGKPDIAELEKFKEPGYFSEFSRMEYLKKVSEAEALVSNEE
jgi:hypothetical protein